MKRRGHRWLGVTALALPLAVFAGCTIVNAFDDVKPEVDASTGDDVSVQPDTSVADAAEEPDAPAVTEAGPADAGPPKGAIVLGASDVTDGGEDLVLTALAPETGHELQRSREKMKVEAVVYDGLRDLWYIFESGGDDFFPLPDEPVFLHVRKLETHTGEWTELSKVQVPTLVSFTMLTTVRERLVFVAYKPEDGAVGYQLVTLDTSNPAAVTTLPSPIDLTSVPLGIIGTRTDVGLGLVTLLYSGPCVEAGTCVTLTKVIVPDTGSPTMGTPVTTDSRFAGTPGYGSFLGTAPVDVIATRATFAPGPQDSTLATFSPQTADPVGAPLIFRIGGPNLKPLAFAECQRTALLGETNADTQVYAVQMDDGGVAKGDTGHSGQGVYYEPYTSTVLAPFSQGTGYTLTALHLAAGQITKRTTDWDPPRGIRPHIVATRTPVPFTECPTP